MGNDNLRKFSLLLNSIFAELFSSVTTMRSLVSARSIVDGTDTPTRIDKALVKWLQYLWVAVGILALIPICFGLLSEDRITSSLSGIAICGLMIWGFVIIQRSRN